MSQPPSLKTTVHAHRVFTGRLFLANLQVLAKLQAPPKEAQLFDLRLVDSMPLVPGSVTEASAAMLFTGFQEMCLRTRMMKATADDMTASVRQRLAKNDSLAARFLLVLAKKPGPQEAKTEIALAYAKINTSAKTKTLELEELFVDQQFERQGIAKLLIAFAQTIASMMDVQEPKVVLTCTTELAKFYEKLGFVQTEHNPQYYFGVTMSLQASRPVKCIVIGPNPPPRIHDTESDSAASDTEPADTEPADTAPADATPRTQEPMQGAEQLLAAAAEVDRQEKRPRRD